MSYQNMKKIKWYDMIEDTLGVEFEEVFQKGLSEKVTLKLTISIKTWGMIVPRRKETAPAKDLTSVQGLSLCEFSHC